MQRLRGSIETRERAKFCRERGENLALEIKRVDCDSPYESSRKFCEDYGRALGNEFALGRLTCPQCVRQPS